MASILVTGGTGLIGKYLCNLLRQKGHSVSILSRNKTSQLNTFYWNVDANYIDPEALINIDFIIHLAGAGIVDKRWTKSRKVELINSRVNSTNLLFEKIKEHNPNLKGFISASGIGYYGATTTDKIFKEEDKPGTDFISEICILWEKAVNQFNSIGIKTVIFRTGIVLTKEGGALEKISKPIKLGFGSALGSGHQYMPWIHIDDLCKMYLEAIEKDKFNGIYNATAPEHITNKAFTKSIAKLLGKHIWLPNIPSFILKIILGEMSIILLKGSRISCEKLEKLNFQFKYPKLKIALENLVEK
ncbi:TIGR01777 family oxidoreductase [Lutibacter flavus]|uniref:TIGR01777 family protein n=1 Tax=Lutibacter flavus TaxID=691689 RepID=A0A238XPU2_9FLAO|nr:TIGR01777 family oxidoreductase [Lutibacter flavus]SNR60598.1 hypothetical protein SAMN04488111_1984 [Lutibacter flavus]